MGSNRKTKAASTARDMTGGSIVTQILLFSIPLMVGNAFQMLYNTVDSIVVGRFVSTQALAAVASTTMIVNIMVFFFNGFSVGAGVVIGRYFGAKDRENLHTAVETTMAMTFILCVFFTIIGILGVRFMLNFMKTPADVFEDATTYLKIYFSGCTGLLIYNIGSGILRAVGDSVRPLMFLVLTSTLNIFLDLLFVIGFHMGIAGVAYATVLAQFISAFLTMMLLTKTQDIYRFVWADLKIDLPTATEIFTIGLPAGIQSMITSFSNVFVQSYVNSFGSSVMAGWGSYNKLNQFIMLPMQSMAMASTTFVAQNIGAGNEERAHKGISTTIALTLTVTGIIAAFLFVFAGRATGLFSDDPEVIRYGALFLRTNVFFLLFNCINHTLAGGLRGLGDARGPMIIMLSCFVALRQIYLFLITNFVINTPRVVGLGYPVGWTACCIIEVTYYIVRFRRKEAEIV